MRSAPHEKHEKARAEPAALNLPLHPSGVWLAALRLRSFSLSAVLLFLACLMLYLSTLVQVHTFDALSYALDVDKKPWQELFHPHHLAYGPLGALVRVLAGALGWSGSAVLPMQLANALAGALGVSLFAALVYALTRRHDLALCGALLLGGSYAYWYYAVEVEVYTIAALFLVLCLWLLVRLTRAPDARLCVLLGLAQGLATLFHQTNVLLCVPAGVALLLAGGQHAGGRWLFAAKLWLAYLLPLALVVGGSYLVVGFGISDFRSWQEFMQWNTAYARTGWWGGPLTGSKLVELGRGLAGTLAHPYGAWLLLFLVGLLVLYLRRLLLRWRRLVLCLAAWLVVYGAFFLWWEPGNAEFWIASLPPACLLLLLALEAGGPRWHAGVWLTLAVALSMLVSNYGAVVARGTGAYTPQRAIAAALAARSAPGDLLLVPDGLQELSLQYYEGRANALSLSQVLAESGGDWNAACGRIQGRIEAAMSSGVAVLIADGVLQPADGVVHPTLRDAEYGDPLLRRFRLQQREVDACFAPYALDMLPVTLGAGLPGYARLPSAQELLEGPGWNFTRHSWGWRAQNVSDQHFLDDDRWSFIPQADPHVTSPRVTIDTSRYWAIELRMAKEVANREAQIFFVDESGIVEEARSLRWELRNYAEMKTYHLDLREHPAWTGTLGGLRLDPAKGPDDDPGERVILDWIRLLSYEDDPPDY